MGGEGRCSHELEAGLLDGRLRPRCWCIEDVRVGR